MPRPTNGVRTPDAIREAAIELFYEHGYEATSLREVAAKVGIRVGSLYNHISGKDELLSSIMTGIMDDLLGALRSVLRQHKDDPVAALRACVDTHIRFHAQRAHEVFIGNSELRALPAKARRRVVAKRDQYEKLIRGVIEELSEKGEAEVVDARLQTYAIVAMGTHVSSWYKPRGGMSLEAIVQAYTEMILRQVGISSDVGSEAVAMAGS
ncbi:TetR/AcrR family transcriptional regulator [Saccharopolyspora shandongensis]|uniref:TetR/AcrR family transcriptional regulator n=1 Tax=Saccharopolyspora shandongensis TaxID=418495 RepID=UPI0033DD3928